LLLGLQHHVGSLLVSLLTLAAPLAALALVVFFLWLTIHLVRSWIRGARFSEETRPRSSKLSAPKTIGRFKVRAAYQPLDPLT
jgi:hypothetical protein